MSPTVLTTSATLRRVTTRPRPWKSIMARTILVTKLIPCATGGVKFGGKGLGALGVVCSCNGNRVPKKTSFLKAMSRAVSWARASLLDAGASRHQYQHHPPHPMSIKASSNQQQQSREQQHFEISTRPHVILNQRAAKKTTIHLFTPDYPEKALVAANSCRSIPSNLKNVRQKRKVHGSRIAGGGSKPRYICENRTTNFG